MLVLTFSAPIAHATDLVVHANPNPALALQQVVNTTELGFEQLFPVTMTDLIAQRTPLLQGSGQLYLCSSAPTTLQTSESTLASVRDAITYGEIERATELLRMAVATIGCLVEPLSPELAARTYFYRGYLELSSGRDDLARVSYRQAKLYKPDLDWDFFFPPEQRSVFDEVVIGGENEIPAQLKVFPPPAVGTLRINGQTVDLGGEPVELHAGIHIVQFGTDSTSTMMVALRPGDQANLVVPSLMPPESVNWADNEHLRPALGAVFRASVQPDITVFVVGDTSVWEFDVSEGDWANSIVVAEDLRIHMSKQAGLAKQPKRMGVYSTSVASGLATVAAAFFGASGAAAKKARDAESDYDSALLENDQAGAAALYTDRATYQRRAAGFRGVGMGTLLLAGGGGAFAVFNFQVAHSRRRGLAANNPYALELAPAAEDPGTAPVKTEE